MKVSHILLTSALLLVSVPALNAFPSYGYSMLSPRPQTTNGEWDARNDFAWIYQNQLKPSHLFDISLNFAQSFQPEELAAEVFGDSVINIEGSMLPNRNAMDFMADQFALSPFFASTVTFRPQYRSIVIPATAIVDLDQCFGCHAYFRITVPFVWASTNLCTSEDIADPEDNIPFPPDYFGVNSVTPLTSFTQALMRTQPVGALIEPLKFGRITCEQSDARLANITCDLGINPIFDDEHSFGIFARMATPNARRPTAKFLFEPFVGNAHQWELGAGIKGHQRIWCGSGDNEFSVYLALALTHLFAGRQHRSFDLCQNGSGFFSRYLLAKTFDANGNATGNLAPLINYSTLPCKVSATFQLDGVFMATYLDRGFHFDFGYELYLRTQEKAELLAGIPARTLGIKGVQNTNDTITNLPINTTQHTATIFGPSFDQQMFVVDNPSPQFVTTEQLNLRSGLSPQILTQKLFAYLGYQWDCLHRTKSFQPYIGIGFDVEFQGGNEAEAPIWDVDNNTLCQWNIQWRGGFLFG
jgi:hypothetical protein